MIRSMTGYGKAEMITGAGRVVVEIRSVNHRYGEIFVKLPRMWLALENDVRKCVAARLARGKIEVYVQLQGGAAEEAMPAVNLPVARAYRDAFDKLRDELGLEGAVTLSLIAAQRDVLVAGETGTDPETVKDDLVAAVTAAVDSLDGMRLKEGTALLEDIRQRQDRLLSLCAAIAERSPRVTAEYASRLKERVALLVEGGVDDARLAQEVALMADRSDITEEVVRFRSHLQQFDETLGIPGSVGRKLDFILQELNREVNTIGSKAGDGEIAAAVVELKAELEKIREQVQNVE